MFWLPSKSVSRFVYKPESESHQTERNATVVSVNVYIANFGRANTSWPNCLKRSTIAVLDGLTVHPYWQRGDRKGYIEEAQRVYKSRVGRPVITPVASRWFNLNDIFRATDGDICIHREKEQLWWTISTWAPVESEIIEDPRPVGGFETVHIFHKRCQPWSNRSRKGSRARKVAVSGFRALGIPVHQRRRSEISSLAAAQALSFNAEPAPNQESSSLSMLVPDLAWST
jgi:hypothetical protein